MSVSGSGDLRAVGSLDTSVPASQADNPKLRRAANDFEAMAIGEMLQPMFDTVDDKDDFFGGGAGEQMFKPMLVQEMAKSMEHAGGIGLSESIYRQMLKLQERKA